LLMSHDDPLSLVILIVNFRTPELTIDCLRTLQGERDESGMSFEVVLVDNDSGDGSVEQIEQAIAEHGWVSWVRFVVSQKNLGFSGGNNLALRHASFSDYVLLLNSDTKVHPGCFRACKQVMEQQPDVGALSCLVLNDDGSVQNVCRRLPKPLCETARALGLVDKLPRWFGWADTEDLGWDRLKEARDVEWIGGAFMWLRRPLVERIGLLDETFFFYGEDVEFNHRIWRSGSRVHYSPTGTITHLGGGSSTPSNLPTQSRQRMVARYQIQRVCYGRLAAWWLRVVDFAVGLVRLAKHALLSGPRAEPTRQRLDALKTLWRLIWARTL